MQSCNSLQRKILEDFTKKFHLHLQPIIVPYEQNTGHTLALLLAGVLLLLAIGCANCSILLLARGEARQHELAVRSAIGASRWRIIRQLLVEALVVSFSGAALGVVSSYWLAKLPLQLSPNSFPPESVIRINLPILMFSAGLALPVWNSFRSVSGAAFIAPRSGTHHAGKATQNRGQ